MSASSSSSSSSKETKSLEVDESYTKKKQKSARCTRANSVSSHSASAPQNESQSQNDAQLADEQEAAMRAGNDTAENLALSRARSQRTKRSAQTHDDIDDDKSNKRVRV